MSKFSTIRFKTSKELDKERAVYVTFSNGEIVNTYQQVDQGTRKLDCIVNKHHKSAYAGTTCYTTPTEFKRLCAMHKHI